MPCGCGLLQCVIMLVYLLTTVILVAVLLSSTLIQSIDIVHRNVTLSEHLNGTLALGSLGYCLTASNNATLNCTAPSFPYSISNTNVLAQVKLGSIITKGIPVANALAVVAAAIAFLGTLCLGNSGPHLVSCFSGLGACTAFVGLVFDILFITGASGINSAGTGFWLTAMAIVILLLFGICLECGSRKPRRRPAARGGGKAGPGKVGPGRAGPVKKGPPTKPPQTAQTAQTQAQTTAPQTTAPT